MEKKEPVRDTVYPLEIISDSKNISLQQAEEKTVKALQKHSIRIKNKQHNPQIFNAYLLLGKTRYFSGRFAPALEAFSEIIYQNAKGRIRTTAKIWIAKTKIKLYDAKWALKILPKLSDLKRQQKIHIHQTLFMAHKSLGNWAAATKNLEASIRLERSKKKQDRAKIILAQIYHKQKKTFAAQKILKNMIFGSCTAQYKIVAFYKILQYELKKQTLKELKNELVDLSKKLAYLPYEQNVKALLKDLEGLAPGN